MKSLQGLRLHAPSRRILRIAPRCFLPARGYSLTPRKTKLANSEFLANPGKAGNFRFAYTETRVVFSYHLPPPQGPHLIYGHDHSFVGH